MAGVSVISSGLDDAIRTGALGVGRAVTTDADSVVGKAVNLGVVALASWAGLGVLVTVVQLARKMVQTMIVVDNLVITCMLCAKGIVATVTCSRGHRII
jgi:hypothetical protein